LCVQFAPISLQKCVDVGLQALQIRVEFLIHKQVALVAPVDALLQLRQECALPFRS
jgi:hypothetical protein